jgi:hypothetical protein
MAFPYCRKQGWFCGCTLQWQARILVDPDDQRALNDAIENVILHKEKYIPDQNY